MKINNLHYLETNILQVNDKSNDIYDCTFIRIRNEFTNRAITMCFDDTLFAIMNYFMYNICNLIMGSNNLKLI